MDLKDRIQVSLFWVLDLNEETDDYQTGKGTQPAFLSRKVPYRLGIGGSSFSSESVETYLDSWLRMEMLRRG